MALNDRLGLMGTDHVDAYLTHDTVVSTEVWSPIQEAKRHELALSLGTSWDPVGPSHDLNRVWPGMELTQLRLGPCGSDMSIYSHYVHIW